MKILFSNLGYAKGISGTLEHHLAFAHRHVYTKPDIQRRVLAQFRAIIDREQPDICCLVEIDSGSVHSGYLRQMEALLCGNYCFHDAAGKYGEEALLARMPLHFGKSNGFIARAPYPFRRRYFSRGSKRLVYEIALPENVTLFFSHFSLLKHVRAQQLREAQALVLETRGEVILLGDFNILHGFGEIAPLLDSTGLRLLNRQSEPTFTFHRRRMALDLCLCSPVLGEYARLRIIPQSFSDHAALLVEY